MSACPDCAKAPFIGVIGFRRIGAAGYERHACHPGEGWEPVWGEVDAPEPRPMLGDGSRPARVGQLLCPYHDLITGAGSDPLRQALAISVDPEVFEQAAASHAYKVRLHPDLPLKYTDHYARRIRDAYGAADRVAVLVGWGWP